MRSARVIGVGARLSKLRAMSAAEIAHRVRYKAELMTERRRHRAGTLVRADRLERSVIPRFGGPEWKSRLLASRRTGPSAFFAGTANRDAMRSLFHSEYEAELQDTARQAAETRAHRFAFFGQQFAFGDEIPWQTDPVTGREWPHVYHADVPVHGGNVGYGDVKHVWELSRHQFLVDLGKSWFLTGNPDDVAALQRLVRSWIAGNPYGTGVNWSCALEPAFRVFSWLWAYELTADALDDDFHAEWLEGFLDHGRFIERHLERYTSPYNHLIGEAAALYMLGAFLPELADAPRWRATARQVLTTRLEGQFYGDGGTVEQSTFYHHATVGFYLLAGLSSRVIGEELPPTIWAAIERGLEFSLMLTQPDGFTPAIGGADDGKPIRMEHLPFWDFRPYLAVGAVLFGRGDFKRVAGRFHEDALWLLGPEGRQAFLALPAVTPRQTSEARPRSGYFVLRSDWTATADYVCVDCGEQADGMRHDAVPNSMHGHADCLSIVAWLGGRRILVDSGLYSYNAGGAWEAHFRETAAHCTATIDGRDQAKHLGKMAWSHSYAAAPEDWHADGRDSWFTGSHDGYARGPEGVRHRRTVWLRAGAWLAVYDEFDGSGRHDYAVHYQFAPGDLRRLSSAEDACGSARFDGAAQIGWSEGWAARFACGGDGPADGWIAPSLGRRTPAPRITLSRTSADPHVRLLTIFVSLQGDRRLVALRDTGPAAAPVFAVVASNFVDVVTVPAVDVPRAAGIPPIAVCRVPTGDSGDADPQGAGMSLDIDDATWRRLARTARESRP